MKTVITNIAWIDIPSEISEMLFTLGELVKRQAGKFGILWHHDSKFSIMVPMNQ